MEPILLALGSTSFSTPLQINTAGLLKFGSHGAEPDQDLIEKIPYYAFPFLYMGSRCEFMFHHLKDGWGKSKSKAGYEKNRVCGEQARKDSLQYFFGGCMLHIGMSPTRTIPLRKCVYTPLVLKGPKLGPLGRHCHCIALAPPETATGHHVWQAACTLGYEGS
jgi:hypothetical protein